MRCRPNTKGETMGNIAKKLDEQIETDLEELSQMTLGSETREKMQDQFVELYNLRLNEQRQEREHEAQVWGRKLKLALDALGLMVPNGIALYSVIKVMKFEETGFVKTFSGRRVLGWIKPIKLLKLFK